MNGSLWTIVSLRTSIAVSFVSTSLILVIFSCWACSWLGSRLFFAIVASWAQPFFVSPDTLVIAEVSLGAVFAVCFVTHSSLLVLVSESWALPWRSSSCWAVVPLWTVVRVAALQDAEFSSLAVNTVIFRSGSGVISGHSIRTSDWVGGTSLAPVAYRTQFIIDLAKRCSEVAVISFRAKSYSFSSITIVTKFAILALVLTLKSQSFGVLTKWAICGRTRSLWTVSVFAKNGVTGFLWTVVSLRALLALG